MRIQRTTALGLAGVLAMFAACSPEPAEPRQQAMERTAEASDVEGALGRFKAQDASLQGVLDSSAGYAVFPDVGKAAVVVGGSYGKGEVFNGHGMRIGYARITQATVGAQAGAQTFSELIVFNTKDAFEKFKSGELTFAANASAVLIKAGAGASSRPNDGLTIFVEPKGGLMAEAAIGGQKFRFDPI